MNLIQKCLNLQHDKQRLRNDQLEDEQAKRIRTKIGTAIDNQPADERGAQGQRAGRQQGTLFSSKQVQTTSEYQN